MGNQKLKIIYILSILAFCSVGLYGDLHNAYVEQASKDIVMSKYIWIIILVSIAIGIVAFIFFKKAFPVGYEKQGTGGLTLILFVFMILAFPFNRGHTILINETYTEKSVTISGNIKKKYLTKGSKGWKTYFLVVESKNRTIEYKFEVSKYVYNHTPDSAIEFNKKFEVGALGIVYRNDF
jgi:hypothetical protein